MGNQTSTTPTNLEDVLILDKVALLQLDPITPEATSPTLRHLTEDFDTIYDKRSGAVEYNLCVNIRDGALDLLQAFLETDPTVAEMRDSMGSTLLHLAARYNQIKIVEYLVKYVEVNTRDCDDNTALHHAARHQDASCLKVLLENDANVNAQSKSGETALLIATRRECYETVKLLLSYKASVNIQSTWGNIEAGADVNIQDKLKRTPLHNAIIQYGQQYSIKSTDKTTLRLNSKMPIQSEPFETDTTLHLLAAEEDVDLNIQDCFGKTVLHYASIIPDQAFYTKLFLERKADPNIQDNFGRSPLHLAINLGNINSITALLNANADVNLCNNAGQSVLKLALDKNLDISGHLLDNIANLSVTDHASYKVVEKALMMNVPGILACLIGRSEKVDGPSHEVKNNELTTEYLERRLDACIEKKDRNICMSYVTLLPSNFRSLETLLLIFLGISRDNKFEQLLQHPSVQTIFKWKWQQISTVYYINLGFYLFTCLNICLYKYFYYCTNAWDAYGAILYAIMIFNVLILIIREGFQAKMGLHYYFTSIENIVEVLFIAYALVLIFFWNPDSVDIKIQISALGNILIALSLTLMVGHHPFADSAVHLLRTVTYKFLRYFMIYIAIMMSFSFSFVQLNSNAKNSANSNSSALEEHAETFLQTVSMFIGELNVGDFLSTHNNYASKLILFIFIIFISVIVLNLLNGLAISNILEKSELQISQNKARLEYLYNLDRSINSINDILSCLPRYFSQIIPKRPNQNISVIFVLPDYTKYENLNLKGKYPDHSYLYNNKIHKDAYEKLQQKQFEHTKLHENFTEVLELRFQEMKIDFNNKNIKFMQELKLSRNEFVEELIEIRKMLLRLTSENMNSKTRSNSKKNHRRKSAIKKSYSNTL